MVQVLLADWVCAAPLFCCDAAYDAGAKKKEELIAVCNYEIYFDSVLNLKIKTSAATFCIITTLSIKSFRYKLLDKIVMTLSVAENIAICGLLSFRTNRSYG